MSALVVFVQMTFISLALSQEQRYSNNLGSLTFIIAPTHNISLPSSTPWVLPSLAGAIRRDDYTYTSGIGGHKVHTRAVTWNEARRICGDEGGHLAIINSIAEANAIADLFNKSGTFVGGTGSSDWAFIGFHDLFQEGEYVTVHSQSLAKAGYTQWANGQPDNGGGKENCGSVNKKGAMNDITCSGKYGFICELPIN